MQTSVQVSYGLKVRGGAESTRKLRGRATPEFEDSATPASYLTDAIFSRVPGLIWLECSLFKLLILATVVSNSCAIA